MIYKDEIDRSKYKIEYLGEKFSKEFKDHKVIVLGRYGVGKTTIIIYKLWRKRLMVNMSL